MSGRHQRIVCEEMAVSGCYGARSAADVGYAVWTGAVATVSKVLRRPCNHCGQMFEPTRRTRGSASRRAEWRRLSCGQKMSRCRRWLRRSCFGRRFEVRGFRRARSLQLNMGARQFQRRAAALPCVVMRSRAAASAGGLGLRGPPETVFCAVDARPWNLLAAGFAAGEAMKNACRFRRLAVL
jgi:hypothetical protein